jgi:CBS-domain-containing membrane protein
MPENYRPLTLHLLEPGATYLRPRQETLEHVTMDSPAIDVMTDLTHVTTLTVDPSVSIDTALQKMIHGGVRLLLVTSAKNVVLGVISSRDIQGENPLKLVNRLGITHEEILVRDIMTPSEKLDVLLMEDVSEARVGDVVATLKRAGRHHALAVESGEAASPRAIRGIFSATQIGRQLGIAIEIPEVATTFAQIEAVLRS